MLLRYPVLKIRTMQLSNKREVWLATKPGLIHRFLHQEIPLPSQDYDSYIPFVRSMVSTKQAIFIFH